MGMKIELLPACEGDALWVTFDGACGASFNILVDGGREATGRILADRVKATSSPPLRLDLLVVTHVDRDHIQGIIELLRQCDDSQLEIGDIWFNGYKHLSAPLVESDALQEQGAVMGSQLEALILERKIPWNQAFKGSVIAREETSFPMVALTNRLRATVLGPTLGALRNLRPRWEAECKRAEVTPGCPDASELDLAEQAAGPGDFDFSALCDVPFSDDNSLPNASSIIILLEDTEGAGQSVLLAGDATAHSLQNALTTLRDQRGDLRIDAFKVPHHGSARNVSLDLLAAVCCSSYLVSTNGTQFQHPCDAAIARIIQHGRQSGMPATLYFNYRSHRTEGWCDAARQTELGYTAKVAPSGSGISWP